MMPSRTDRLYLGWQYATPHPDPGPPPRRPTPPEHERLDPAWAAAQRREESLLNRPLKSAFLVATVIGALAVAAGAAGWLPILAAGLAVIGCVLVAAVCGYGVWQGERALRSRMADERSRVGKIRAAQESELSAWQAGHATRVREWQAQRAAHEQQKRWYGVSVPDGITRVDVAGGTLSGWSAMLATAAGHRLAAGAEVTVLDLTEGSVALDLIAFAQDFAASIPSSGCCPTTCLGSASVPDWTAGGWPTCCRWWPARPKNRARRATSAFDNAILERVIGVLGGTATVAGVAAALRALAQAGDPREDVAAGLISAEQLDRLTTMFGRGAADRVVVERAWVLESQLRTLAAAGTAVVPLPRSPLRVVAVSQPLRFGRGQGAGGLPGRHADPRRCAGRGRDGRGSTRCSCSARTGCAAIRSTGSATRARAPGSGWSSPIAPSRRTSGSGSGAGTPRWPSCGSATPRRPRPPASSWAPSTGSCSSQLTETVGLSVTDTTAGSYTSTTGSVSSLAASWSASEGTPAAPGRSRTGHGVLPWPRTSRAARRRQRFAQHHGQRIGQRRRSTPAPPGARPHPGPPATASRWPSACSAPASSWSNSTSCSSCRPAR